MWGVFFVIGVFVSWVTHAVISIWSAACYMSHKKAATMLRLCMFTGCYLSVADSVEFWGFLWEERFRPEIATEIH